LCSQQLQSSLFLRYDSDDDKYDNSGDGGE
jgi:hypothetical protein